jgi:TatD DNase family protein
VLVDTHAHIDRYGSRSAEAVRQINEQRIVTVGVSMDVDSYRATLRLSESSPYLKPAFGIHPWEAPRYRRSLAEIDELLQQTPMIGEIGLDFFFVKDHSLYASQRVVFEYQCEWASRLGKIVNLHTKGAEREVLDTLNRLRIARSVVHWYSGPKDLIEEYLAAGSYFTIGVEILASGEIQAIARLIPLERLLLETDNPGGYEWLTGSIGMPVIIRDVLAKLAEVTDLQAVELESQLYGNWLTLTGGIQEFGQPSE